VSYPSISKASAISLPTLYKWAQDERAKKRLSSNEFHQLPVVLSDSELPKKPSIKPTTITVIAPSGLKVIGLKVADACKIIREFER
jgi:hypothetical protein